MLINARRFFLIYAQWTFVESDTMKPKKPTKPNAEHQHQLDLELVKRKPTNRAEARAHLAAQLRISKHKANGRKGFKSGVQEARAALSKANATRFSDGVVESVDTDRISECNKRWRGKTAD